MNFKAVFIISLALFAGAVYIGIMSAQFQRETSSRLLKYGSGSFVLSSSEIDAHQGSVPSPNPSDAPITGAHIDQIYKSVRNLTQNQENFQKMTAIRRGEIAEFKIELVLTNLENRRTTFELADRLDAGILVDESQIKFQVNPLQKATIEKPEGWINGEPLKIVLEPYVTQVKVEVLFAGQVLSGAEDFLTNESKIQLVGGAQERRDKAYLAVAI